MSSGFARIFAKGKPPGFSRALLTARRRAALRGVGGASAFERRFGGDANVVGSSHPDVVVPDVPLHEFAFEKLAKWENEIAAICAVTGRRYTHGEVMKRSRSLAASIRNKFKLKRGDRMAVALPNCPEFPFLLLASSMTGNATSTINPQYTAGEIAFQVKRVKPKLLFTSAAMYQKCSEALRSAEMDVPIVVAKLDPDSEIPDGAVSFSEMTENFSAEMPEPEDWKATDDLVVPFSSGTSGLPKGVLLSHGNIVSNLTQFERNNKWRTRFDQENKQCSVVAVLPMFHIYGMVVIALDALRCGNRLICMPGFEAGLFLETIVSHEIQVLYAAPPLVSFLGYHPAVEAKHLQHLKCLMNGAAPSGPKDIEAVCKKAERVKFVQGYGLTETSPVVTITHEDRSRKTTSVGHPLSSTLIKVVDVDSGKSLPEGVPGEIRVKGPQVMKGYLDVPEETKNAFDEEGWFKTGDVGYYDSDRDFYVVDRMKELIKVKGFQVSPAELEDQLRAHPKIADAAVVGVRDPVFGEVPRAFVVAKKGISVSEKEIRDHVERNLSGHKHLRGGVRFIEEIPKASSGKILRRILKESDEKK